MQLSYKILDLTSFRNLFFSTLFHFSSGSYTTIRLDALILGQSERRMRTIGLCSQPIRKFHFRFHDITPWFKTCISKIIFGRRWLGFGMGRYGHGFPTLTH